MPVQLHSFWLPKRGHKDEECEDACLGNDVTGRFAIADGATESYAAKTWAQLLVEGFVNSSIRITSPKGKRQRWSSWLPPLQKQWAANFQGRSLPWYAENGIQEGAFAAFVGLVLEEPCCLCSEPLWRAVAVGDSCLFHIQQGRLSKQFPIEKAKEFGNSPRLIGSRDAAEDVASKKVKTTWGKWRLGDQFLLLTDALAQWFLQQYEAEQKPWEAVESLLASNTPKDRFAAWVEELRDMRELRNDDVTLLVVRL